ncbi:ATP-binding protein [Hahella ganghwensis]|uniref:ATP-binding protein n=1 Tax=Hahella ganghwensis TaxID=286420 RepID=UPI00037E9D52|nr:ATP-binding protein [Hahella ganghwensis]
MFRAFFRLLLVILVPLVLAIYVESYNPVFWVQKQTAEYYFTTLFKGTFFLIEQKLEGLPEEEWETEVAQWKNEFGYQLSISSLNEVIEEFEVGENIYNGEFVFTDNDDTGHLIRRIGQSGAAIVLALEETDDEETQRAASGTLFLLKDYFSRTPESEWPKQIGRLQSAFGFELKLVDLEDLPLAEEELSEFRESGYTWEDEEDESSVFYLAMEGSRQVLIAGPTFPSTNVFYLLVSTLVVAFLLVISLALLSWLMPLWRDLKTLDQTAREFGQGHLERRVEIRKSSIAARLAGSFNGMANSIQKLLRSHQQLTNAVAHDLRTPLARLRFAVEMLESDDCTDEERTRYRKSVNNSIGVLEDLINQLLIYSRYSRQTDINHFNQSKLSVIVREEVEMQEAESNGLHCEFICDEFMEGRSVWVDSRAITRALDNMLSNASRFARSVIRVTLYQKSGTCYLKVEDDGQGIPVSERERILQPFAQLNNPERGASSGHGLGLAIVSQIAQWHGGTLKIFDSPLGGAGFEFSWPVKTG